MDKPRLVPVSAVEAAEIAEAGRDGALNVPVLIERIYADADELRAWRAARYESIKEAVK